jgi:hypothetical protein
LVLNLLENLSFNLKGEIMKIEKLYSGITFSNNINGWNNVVVQWYYSDWKLHWADIDYSEMIQDYSFMTDDEKSISRDYVNQLFTGDEIGLLKDYLMKIHQVGIYIRERPLPIETYYIDDKTGKRRFNSVYYPSEHSGNTIHLDRAEDYELHFPVNGNYQPGDGIPSEKLSEECLEDGVNFIRAVLRSFRYKAKWSDRKIAKILMNIYGKDGFYVMYRSPETEAIMKQEIS